MRRILLACLLASGCSTQNVTASYSLSPIEPYEFHCPKAGTRVTFSTGSVTRYTGFKQTSPVTCTGVFGDGNYFQRVYNYWDESRSVLADVAPAMAQLFPATVGKSANFVFYGSPVGSGTLSQRYTENWRVLGGEEIKLGSRSVRTIVFYREAAGADTSNTSLIRYKLWFAPDLGVWVRSDVTAIRGYTGNRSFSVANVEVP